MRDAQGNVLAVYTRSGNNTQSPLLLSETHLYGSSRLGLVQRSVNMGQSSSTTEAMALLGSGKGDNFTRGQKLFELSNHLGNVLATVTDRKTGIDTDADGLINHYTADISTAQDYYAFGMAMPGRKYSAGSTTYRYGFNGKENDPESKGEGNQYDFGSRTYDPRLGRFLSIDPFATQIPFNTPYSFAGNKPIWAIDADGEVEVIINYIHKDANGKVSRKSYNMGDIKTAEDIRGISRTPIQINVYSESVLVQQGNMQYFTHKQTKIEIVKESGETKGEEMKRTDPLQYYLAKLVIDNPLGTGKLNMAAQKRDPFTGERISNGLKVAYVAEGLINMATLGRASNTGNLTKVLKSWTQDFFAEQGSEIFFKKMEGVFGIDASEHAVIMYHVANFVMDGKKGELNDLRDFLLRSADAGLKGDKFLNKLREERGINAEIPKDAKEAANKVIKDFNISGQH